MTPLFRASAGASWLDSNGDLFPSEESFRHWFRRHREPLVAARVVVLHRAAWLTDASALRQYVLDEAGRAAQRAVSAAS